MLNSITISLKFCIINTAFRKKESYSCKLAISKVSKFLLFHLISSLKSKNRVTLLYTVCFFIILLTDTPSHI